MKRLTGWIFVVLFSTALIGGFFWLKQSTSGAAAQFALGTSTTSPQTSRLDYLPSRQPLPGVKEYRSNDHHFSLKYPGDIPPQEWQEGGHAMTIAFQKNAGEEGFQIYVAPINGTKITEDRFQM